MEQATANEAVALDEKASAEALHSALNHLPIPILLGILPLRTPKHADFLHEKVSGILVPDPLRKRMHEAGDPVSEGVRNAKEMLHLAKSFFKGACIMPPFDHYEILPDILAK